MATQDAWWIYLAAGGLLSAIVCGIVVGVMPRLRGEPAHGRALYAWIDVWIPLALAVPAGLLAMAAPRTTSVRADVGLWSEPLFFLAILPLAACCGAAGVAMALPRHEAFWLGPDRRHGLMLVALGAVLLAAAAADRLALWHGQALLTAAILWLWTVSADPVQRRGPYAGAKRGGSSSPVFVVDWAGPIRSPVPAGWKLVLLIAPIGLGIVFLSAPAASTVLASGMTLAVAQAVALVILAARLDPRLALRCAWSCLALSIMLGVGLRGVRLMPWGFIVAGLRGEPLPEARGAIPLEVVGAGILRPAGVLLVGLGLTLGIAPGLLRRSPLAGAALALAAVFMLIPPERLAGLAPRRAVERTEPPSDLVEPSPNQALDQARPAFSSFGRLSSADR